MTLSEAAKAVHALDRLGYGPRPGDVVAVRALGAERWIASQLDPQSLTEPSALTSRLASLKTLRMAPVDLFGEYGPPERRFGFKPGKEAVKERRKKARVVVQEAAEARVARALLSERQLEQTMTEFWFDHFNVFADKGLVRIFVGVYENQALRPRLFGKFRDLLGAVVKHPAMLIYLDNHLNTAPGSPGAKKKRAGLNENYARELLELHTLGVDGGYTQADVVALARILTGWGLPPKRRRAAAGGFDFDKRRHDFNDKVLLGRTIAGRGVEEGEEALDLLASHPSTARYVAARLARFFVADAPARALVERLAATFRETDGRIDRVLAELFASPEFWDPAQQGAKFKSPYRYLLSAARACGVESFDVGRAIGLLRQWGMPLYHCLTPDGYKHVESAWLNPDALMRRLSFATALGSGRLDLATGDSKAEGAPLDSEALERVLGGLSQKTRAAVGEAPQRLRAALVLGSPEFMRY